MVNSTTRWMSALLGAFAFGLSATAQTMAWEARGFEGWRVGYVVPGTDVDGDGHTDMLLYADLTSKGAFEVTSLSGRLGTPIRVHTFTQEQLQWRSPVKFGSVGDFDCDGVGDWYWLLSGSTYPGLEVRSGQDGTRLMELRAPSQTRGWCYAVLGGADTDGDGWPELILSHIDRNGPRSGSILAYRRDGQLLYTLDSPPNWAYGSALATIGDVDVDGADDFVMGAGEESQRGAAILVSGRQGRILQIGYGERELDRMDYSVAGCGDMDGDGVADFAGGSFWGARGVARVFSGRTGQVLHSWVGPYDNFAQVGAFFGGRLLGGLDVDQDGVPDLITTSKAEIRRNGRIYDTIYALSGRDGRIILEHYDQEFCMTGIFPLVAVKAEGFPTIALRQTRQPDPYDWGRVAALDLTPRGATIYGEACSTTPPGRILIGVSRDVDTYTRITASDVAAGAQCVLLLGTSSTAWQGRRLPLDLSRYGWPGCALWTSVDATVTTIAGATGRYRGLASVDLPWPLAATSSLPLHAQWLSFEPGGIRMTAAVRLELDMR